MAVSGPYVLINFKNNHGTNIYTFLRLLTIFAWLENLPQQEIENVHKHFSLHYW